MKKIFSLAMALIFTGCALDNISLTSNKKTDSKKLNWQKTFGGNKDDEAKSIIQTNNGNFIIAGWTKPFRYGKSNTYIIKIDKNGHKLWQKLSEVVVGTERIL